jgi:hypothetical protein
MGLLMRLARHGTHLDVAEVMVELRVSSWTMSSLIYSIPILRVSVDSACLTGSILTVLRVPVLASDGDEAHPLPRVLQAPHEQRRLALAPETSRDVIATRPRW